MDIDDSRIRFLRGTPAGVLRDYFIVSDLHIGFERSLIESGYNVFDTTNNMLANLISFGGSKLIILGDVRDRFGEIRQEEGSMLMSAFSQLSCNFKEITITKGNHDATLSKITSRFSNITLVEEFEYNGVGFMHGHKLPSKELTQSVDTLCLGHAHPAAVLFDSNGVPYKKDCWLLCDIQLTGKRYVHSKIDKLIVFPKFNPFIGSTDRLEKKGIMKYVKSVSMLTTDFIFIKKKNSRLKNNV